MRIARGWGVLRVWCRDADGDAKGGFWEVLGGSFERRWFAWFRCVKEGFSMTNVLNCIFLPNRMDNDVSEANRNHLLEFINHPT